MQLSQFLPDADAVTALGPEDLGMILLKIAQGERGRNFPLSDLQHQARNLPGASRDWQKIDRVLAEAWQWLINEGLLIVAPDSVGYYCVTRKGAALKSDTDVEVYRQGNLLPVGLLHPRIAEKVRPMFLRGDYDVAVFQAFKEVEVTVRSGGKFDDSLVGTKLMRKAFDADTGPLRMNWLEPSEREALAHLYAGAIGFCKNPQSHRDVGLERDEAAQLIVLASFLLQDVEATIAVGGPRE